VRGSYGGIERAGGYVIVFEDIFVDKRMGQWEVCGGAMRN
jgi:hypothetical protein